MSIGEKNLVEVRFRLALVYTGLLAAILAGTLTHRSDPRRPGYAGGILLIILSMIYDSTTCVLMLLLISPSLANLVQNLMIVIVCLVIILKWEDISDQFSPHANEPQFW
ncbi:hypothetical protein A2U01_0038164 [Trifolium medium]|uniref:Uncharacterized protein n=1 Tax=Trifolium medium TaxID=97028 RepID=A0A392PZ58_9FABA|nr:hypothetical protein [Trifolium medium]